MALIQQGDAMVLQGEMVVLGVEGGNDQEFLRLLACGIRFLRSGCSGVQLLITINGGAFAIGPDENRKLQRQEILDVMGEALDNLHDNGREVFEISSPELWEQGTVITITRRVPEKTKDMTFGEVPERHDFLIVLTDENGSNPKEVRCVKIIDGVGRYPHGVVLEQGGWHGKVVYPLPLYSVKLIL